MKKNKWIRARITEEQFKELKIKLAHEGLTFQKLLENSIMNYLNNAIGVWTEEELKIKKEK